MKKDNLSNMEDNSDIISALRAMPESDVPPGFSETIMKRVEQELEQNRNSLFRTYFPLLAACIALFVCLSILSFYSRTSPDNPAGLINRGAELLSQERPYESLPLLKEAVQKFSANSEAFFFLGMNYGRLEMFDEEQQAYQNAIDLSPDNLMAHYFMGHSYMNVNRFKEAVMAYEKVISINPGFKKAYYNLGLALELSGQTQEALAAWKNYLETQKTGSWAMRAVSHLNAFGDFTYRSFPIGKQKIIMGPFNHGENRQPFEIPDESLSRIGRSMKASDDLDLFVMVYMKEQPETAKDRAISIKRKLLKTYPEIRSDRIKVSWFGEEDQITINQESFSLEESIRFLGIKSDVLNRGVKS